MNSSFQIVIVGGGLAGLAAAIQSSKLGSSVLVLEKGSYPRHKVCGEYLSKETAKLFDQLGINLIEAGAVPITSLVLSNTSGKKTKVKLPLGGISISRYKLENMLYELALDQGVTFLCNHEVVSLSRKNTEFIFRVKTGKEFKGQLALSATGKRSRLTPQPFRKGSFVALKNYYKMSWKDEIVVLHNFKGGYCGLSKVETGLVNACFMVEERYLRKYKDADGLIKKVLSTNPLLHDFFKEAVPVLDSPLSISNINFQKRSSVEDGIFAAGDHAGMIYPLAGNGMAIALQQGVKFAELANQFLSHQIDRKEMETLYKSFCQRNFSRRKLAGRFYQLFMGNKPGSTIALRLIGMGKFFSSWLIKQTHGSEKILMLGYAILLANT